MPRQWHSALTGPAAHTEDLDCEGLTMTDDQPGVGPEPGEDLEYDLAHEATGTGAPARHEQPPRAVVTATPDYDGDYSYDAAHDIRNA